MAGTLMSPLLPTIEGLRKEEEDRGKKNMKWNKKYQYPATTRKLVDSLRHYEVGSWTLPSVTTVLGQTKDQQSLRDWRARIGDLEADRIVNTASKRGTAMHTYLEKYLDNTGYKDMTELGQIAEKMAQEVIRQGLRMQLQEIWGSEVTLYYPGLYAGSTDVVGVYNDEPSIIDFKQSNKPKQEAWIGDYYMQIAAYAMAHDYIHGTAITQGVILMCTPELKFQKFVINGSRLRQEKHNFLRRLNEYYELKHDEKEKANIDTKELEKAFNHD